MRVSLKKRNKLRKQAAGMVSLIFLLIVLSLGCEETNDSKYSPPADHTLSKDGYMHKSGLNQPLTNCADCHGSDLQGGTTGVSCYECHGREW
ncbi:MAG: hypothetical protein ACP5E3_00160 [Bacteroidales bacterium]